MTQGIYCRGIYQIMELLMLNLPPDDFIDNEFTDDNFTNDEFNFEMFTTQ